MNSISGLQQSVTRLRTFHVGHVKCFVQEPVLWLIDSIQSSSLNLHRTKHDFFAIINRYFNDSALRLGTLMWDLGNKMQLCIQGYNKRPYGVGLLVAGYDDLGPHIYQVCI